MCGIKRVIIHTCILDDRNYYEMSSFVETRAERVMKNKATSAKFIQYGDSFDVLRIYCCMLQ